MLARLALLLALAPACQDAQAQDPGTLVYAVDLDAARSAGWTAPDAPDARVLEAVTHRVAHRIRVSGIETGAHASATPEGTLRIEGLAGEPRERYELDGLARRLGRFELRIVATKPAAQEREVDLDVERQRLAQWLEAHPSAPVAAFNGVPREEGGPHVAIEWFDVKPGDSDQPSPPVAERAQPVLVLPEDSTFGGYDLETVGPSQDRLGFPAIRFVLKSDRESEFEEFTGEWVDHQMAIVFDGAIHAAPVIQTRLPGGGVIEGRYDEEQARELVALLEEQRDGGILKPAASGD